MKFGATPLSPQPFRSIEGVRLLSACAVRLRTAGRETGAAWGRSGGVTILEATRG